MNLSHQDRQDISDAYAARQAAGVYVEMAQDEQDSEALPAALDGVREADRLLETVCLRAGVDPVGAHRF